MVNLNLFFISIYMSDWLIGLIVSVIGVIIFIFGRTIHELSHFIVAKIHKIPGIKFSLFKNPMKGDYVYIPDKEYYKLKRNQKFVLLISGFIFQWIFYFLIWIILFQFIENFSFRFLFNLIMFILVIPDIIINLFHKEGDLYRLFRL